MSVAWQAQSAAMGRRLVPMRTVHLGAVMAIEQAAYAVPWTRGNFIDSLASAYLAQCLLDERDSMLGYFVAMLGASEMHLLNLTVAPAAQGRGHARYMLDALMASSRAEGATQLWLEVRASNARARDLYHRFGLAEVGLRKDYYPGAPERGSPGRREDAVVMRMALREAL